MSAYDRLVKQNPKKAVRKNRILTPLDDSDASERVDLPNVFLDTTDQHLYEDDAKMNKKRKQQNLKQIKKLQQSKLSPSKSKRQPKQQADIQLIDDSQIPQGQQVQQNTQFSIVDSFLFYMGQLPSIIKYPMSRKIYIDNNNQQQNLSNRRHAKNQRSSSKDLSNSSQYFFKNQFKVSISLLLLHILTKVFQLGWEFYLYLVVLILSALGQLIIFQGNSQYTVDYYILVFFIAVYIITKFIFQFMLVKKRRSFDDNETKFKVYFHDGSSAEWTYLSGSMVKSGNIYKISSNQTFPADSLLLHSSQSILAIDQNAIKSKLSQSISPFTLKQTIIKSQTIVLPISGLLQLRINSAQTVQNWIQGMLKLDQPLSISHNISIHNIVLKGSINKAETQLLCMVLEVGINSVHIKQCQYPFQYRNNQNVFTKNVNIQTIHKFANNFIQVACIIYVVVSVLGLLIGYLTKSFQTLHYYLGQSVAPANLIYYHLTNFVILLPIWLKISLLGYNYLMGQSIQSNISNRKYVFQGIQSEIKQNNRNLEAQGQSVGQIIIKDYSILPYLKNINVLITGIDNFRGRNGFKLKKVRVKQVNFQLGKDSLQKIQFEQHEQIIKYFMTVSLLSTFTPLKESSNMVQQGATFQQSIINQCLSSFSLKLSSTSSSCVISGPLQNIFANNQLQVNHLFTVKHCSQFPYQVSFFQIPNQQVKENQQKLVLAVVRGNPETVLIKAYGKQIQLQLEADRLHKDGYQVQFVGKITLFLDDVQALKNMYESSSTQISKFYSSLEHHFKKIQAMGLLVFQNEYLQQKVGVLKQNPLLNFSLLKSGNLSLQGHFNSSSLPPLILLCPAISPYQLHPQFQSIHSITSLLTNSYLFNFNPQQVADKILYQPITAEQMILKLEKERVLVWNGWQQDKVRFMIDLLHQKAIFTIAYIQKDQHLYLNKICHYTIATSKPQHLNDKFQDPNNKLQEYNNSQDVNKYSDIDIKPNQSTPGYMVFLNILQLLRNDSHLIYRGLYLLMLTHIAKFICYLTIEIINFAFTLGTGLSVIRLPLYLITQLVLSLDIIFHINFRDSINASSQKKLPNLLVQVIKPCLVALIGSLLIIYCSVSPNSVSGSPTSSQLTILHIHFFITHLLIFSKLFYIQQINLFQLFIVILQSLGYYVGLIIVSEISLYQFNGVLASFFNYKLLLVTGIAIWVYLVVDFAKIILLLDNQSLRKKAQHTYQKVKRIKQQTNLQTLEF